jgi:hypothetical protein
MRWSTLSSALATILATASISLATIIHVPADQPTIQAGIDAAVDGDTVLVAAGTYYETIDFLGKGIVVRGEEGPLTTIITGELDSLRANVVSFVSGEDSSAILERFTVKSGSVSGILCDASSPLIRDNIIRMNSGSGLSLSVWGGSSAVSILHNYIGSNGSTGIFGGFPHSGSALIKGNYIVQNSRGLYLAGGSPRVIENLIGWNTLQGGGGGILLDVDCDALIEGNVIVGNRWGDENGGGIHIHEVEAFPIIRRNLILRNGDEYQGTGGITTFTSQNGIIENNAIVENYGDAIALGYYYPYLTGYQIKNNVIMNNAGWGLYFGGYFQRADLTDVSYNDIVGNGGAFGGSAAPDTGNISSDPQFRLENLFDYSLLASSPCIDAGDPKTAVPEGGGDRVDIGAFEYSIPFNDIALTFISIPDTISRGDTLDLELSLTNPLQSPIVIDVWCTASGWLGSQTVQEFHDLAIPADTIIPLSVSVYVPLGIDAGQYNIHGKVGYVDEWIADAENAIVQVED